MTTSTPPRMALSPSRASDYRTCPLKYRLRAIDRVQEPHSEAQVRGLIVHGVLERLFQLPAAERVPAAAHGLVGAATEALVADRPDTAETARSGDVRGQVAKLIDVHYTVEDPTRIASVETETLLVAETESGVPLKGYVDRTDYAPNGAVRVSDYKTGRAPSEMFEDGATYQLKLYGLAFLLAKGVLPTVLRLIYLNGGTVLTLSPTEDELLMFSKRLTAVWQAILRASETGDFRPRPSKACRFCSLHALCPAQGGTPPAYPGWPDGRVAA